MKPARPARTYRTVQEFYDLAMWYCSKRETSRKKMEQYLTRKARGSARQLDETERESIQSAIQVVVTKLVDQKIIDDDRYAGILVREYQRRTKGKRYIELKLREKGLGDQMRDLVLETEDELNRARQLADKLLNTTRFKKIENPYELKRKLTQRLLAAGFDMSVVRKAI